MQESTIHDPLYTSITINTHKAGLCGQMQPLGMMVIAGRHESLYLLTPTLFCWNTVEDSLKCLCLDFHVKFAQAGLVASKK